MGRLFSFLLRVLRGFKRNQGLLLSGAVAYYTLLSIVPLSILALIVLTMGLGIVLVSFIVGAIETLESRHLTIFGWSLNVGGATGVALYILGIVGEVLMLTSIYLVMPVVRVRFRHALIGGITAAVFSFRSLLSFPHPCPRRISSAG